MNGSGILVDTGGGPLQAVLRTKTNTSDLRSEFKLLFDSAAVAFRKHCIFAGWKECLTLVEPPIAITLKRFRPESACGIHGFNAF